MDPGDVQVLTQVDEQALVQSFNRALRAVRSAEYGDADDRWAGAGQAVCEMLGVVGENAQLWEGLHQAVEASDSAWEDLEWVRNNFDEFVNAEYQLFKQRGYSDEAADQAIQGVERGLASLHEATHDGVEEAYLALLEMTDRLCGGVDDWRIFSEPEQSGRRRANTLVAIAGTSGLVATASNAAAPAFPPLLAGSILGGAAGAISAFFGWRRIRKG